MSYSGATTKIGVDGEVHSALRALKGRGDTFNTVLRKLLGVHEEATEEDAEEHLE